MPNKSIDKNEDSVEKIPNSVEEILKDLYDGEKVKKIYPPVKVIGEVSFKPFEDRPQTYFILGEDGNLYEPNDCPHSVNPYSQTANKRWTFSEDKMKYILDHSLVERLSPTRDNDGDQVLYVEVGFGYVGRAVEVMSDNAKVIDGLFNHLIK
ncbi:MAG: hypothetical protein KKH52_02015 [Nanoarchaeota archaeon]|nr:hypothetical protein [Nanoarchaeota archaeon]MBU1622198.1 hypothetical protein [Nanoarchaeota archaeon]MBU1974147.1 hypothetical protein [Nanoarchaeota archaeon]